MNPNPPKQGTKEYEKYKNQMQAIAAFFNDDSTKRGSHSRKGGSFVKGGRSNAPRNIASRKPKRRN